jgi:uncharacterized protein YndB with AHSA1/START domain
MPTVVRRRELPVAAEPIWRLVADPHNLPRWWPDTVRVESVEGSPQSGRGRFTQVLETRDGKAVRADYRCTAASRPRRVVWEQRIEGTPFDKFLRSSVLELQIEPLGDGSEVSIEGRRALRGLSRLGAPMMSRATRRTLDAALEGIADALAPVEDSV